MRRVPMLAVAILAPGLACAEGAGAGIAAHPSPLHLRTDLSLPLGGNLAVIAGGDWPTLGLNWRASSTDGRYSLSIDAGMAHEAAMSNRPFPMVALVVTYRFQ